MRPSPEHDWLEPVLAGPGGQLLESEEDAEMIAESLRDGSWPDAEVRVLPEGQHPDDLIRGS